jgi:hypothetical protein
MLTEFSLSSLDENIGAMLMEPGYSEALPGDPVYGVGLVSIQSMG